MSTNYQFGYDRNILKVLKSRNVDDSAEFLLPFLKPDMKLLDCGCGPGSVTIGFAKILNKGSVVGVDIEDSQVEVASKAAEDEKLKNISFQKADILNLPFDVDTFDVVFTRATLYHLKDYRKAIREMLRVVKPQGIISAREPDFGAMLIYPENQLVSEAQNLRRQILIQEGLDLEMGRKLRWLFTDAGCQTAIASAVSEPKGDPESLNMVTEYLASELEETEFAKKLLQSKTVTLEQLKTYQAAYREFGMDPGAFILFTWCSVIAFK
jgi:ubiquinone/menaquinone biosynthesis C-methylase UbiE